MGSAPLEDCLGGITFVSLFNLQCLHLTDCSATRDFCQSVDLEAGAVVPHIGLMVPQTLLLMTG